MSVRQSLLLFLAFMSSFCVTAPAQMLDLTKFDHIHTFVEYNVKIAEKV